MINKNFIQKINLPFSFIINKYSLINIKNNENQNKVRINSISVIFFSLIICYLFKGIISLINPKVINEIKQYTYKINY